MWSFDTKSKNQQLLHDAKKIYKLNTHQALEISSQKAAIKELEWEKYVRNYRLDLLEAENKLLEGVCEDLKTQNTRLINALKNDSPKKLEATRIDSINNTLESVATVKKSSYYYSRTNYEFEFVNGICEKLQDAEIKYKREVVCDGGRIDILIPGAPPKIIEAKVDAYPSLVKKAVSQLKRYAQSFPNAELYFAAPREPVGEACSILQEHNISVWTEQAISGVVQ